MIIAVALLVLLAFILMGSGLVVVIAARSRSTGFSRCGECNYNLTGFMGNRCPECGCLFTEVGILPPREKWRMSLALLGAFLFIIGLLMLGFWLAGVGYVFFG